MNTAVQSPRRRPIAKPLLERAGGLMLGVVLGAAIVGSHSYSELGLAGGFGLLAATVFACPLLVGVHELGHLLGGMAVGFRPLLFMVGPLRVEREGERLRVKLAFTGASFSALAVCVPTDARDLRRRSLWMAAGGPLASFIAGIVLLGLRPLLDAPPFADTLLLATGVLSLLMCLVSAIPRTLTGFYSDGARIIRLVRGGADVECEMACRALTGLTMGGVRPRDWSPELVARAAAGELDMIHGVAGRICAYGHELDAGRVDAARAHLEAVLAAAETLPKQSRPGLMLQAARFAARVDRDAARARGFLARAEGGLMVPSHSRLLAEAAIACVEGDRARAAERLDAAEAALCRGIDPGGALMVADEIAALRRELAA